MKSLYETQHNKVKEFVRTAEKTYGVFDNVTICTNVCQELEIIYKNSDYGLRFFQNEAEKFRTLGGLAYEASLFGRQLNIQVEGNYEDYLFVIYQIPIKANSEESL